ncbi:putative phosphatase [Shigella sonnei 3226-85]|nr:putative phosphatase [Shigella sonnei 3226-85]CSE82979.1 putative phosphatase [Shigella sonnei]
MPVARARHKIAGLPAPEVFVTAERVKRGKPEPDAYLLGAQLLGLAPQECVVVEDAPLACFLAWRRVVMSLRLTLRQIPRA